MLSSLLDKIGYSTAVWLMVGAIVILAVPMTMLAVEYFRAKHWLKQARRFLKDKLENRN